MVNYFAFLAMATGLKRYLIVEYVMSAFDKSTITVILSENALISASLEFFLFVSSHQSSIY